VSESAVSAKRVWVSLARNRRSPKRPSEPRLSGVHAEEDEVRKDGVASRLRSGDVWRKSITSQGVASESLGMERLRLELETDIRN
jgi:hypothetical protein